jgi:iron complex transport system ATP-binding protein
LSVTVENLSFSYDTRPVLNDVSFTVEENQLLSVLGPNGVGKSTLFNCILGLLNNYRGTIRVDGQDIRQVSIRDMAKRIAYIPQSHYPSFNYTVFDMVLMGTTHQISVFSTPGKKQIERAEQALQRMGIEHLSKRGFNMISGGERQLTMIARALAQNAHILIMDEPTANLDFGNQIRVLSQIKSLTNDGYTIIQSTHNPDQTFLFSDLVLALKNGAVFACGRPAEIVNRELIRSLYGVDIELQSLFNDAVRVCVPSFAVHSLA